MDWYYALDQRQQGPVSADELARLVDQGTVGSTTLVWRLGLPTWFALRDVVARSAGLPLHHCTGCGQIYSPARLVPLVDHWTCVRCKPWQVQRLLENGRDAASSFNLFLWRGLAKIIDTAILWVVTAVVRVVIEGGAMGLVATSGGNNLGASLLPLLAAMLSLLATFGITAAYRIYFTGKYSATPGKLVCRLRVVQADGNKMTWGLATARHFAEYLSYLTCLIGYLIAAFDPQRRTIHDWVCGTRVVRQ